MSWWQTTDRKPVFAETYGTSPGGGPLEPRGGSETYWVWKARDKAGISRRGVLAAQTRSEVEARLRQLGFQDISARREWTRFSISDVPWWVTPLQRLVFVRVLAMMVDAGVEADAAISVLAAQSARPIARRLARVAAGLRTGESLATALARAPELVGGPDRLSALQIAERAGRLPEALLQLADLVES